MDLGRVEQLHIWNKRVLAFGGIWPLEPDFFKFYVGALYFAGHMVLSFSDLVSVLGDMTLTITNLLETSIQIMIGVKMMALRHSAQLKEVLQQVTSGGNEDRYLDKEEKKLYLSYNTIGRFFFQTGGHFSSMAIVMFFLKPFEDITKAVLHNETIPFVLPCRVHLYYEITDLRIYALVYLWQCPMMYYYYFHTISSCFICTLVVHIAGDLSVLAHRVRQINSSDAPREYGDPEIAFRNVLDQHEKIISTAMAIDDIFNVVLLEELLISTVLLGLTCYNVLAKSFKVSMLDFFFVVNYSMALVVLILVYCIIGDYLIRESMNVHDAYYACNWYNMRSKYRKHLTICMSRVDYPLQLTAGRFYVFSLPRFTDILKTSVAYISMLRTVV